MAVDSQHRNSNESERSNRCIYDDFKLKKPHFGFHDLYKNMSELSGLHQVNPTAFMSALHCCAMSNGCYCLLEVSSYCFLTLHWYIFTINTTDVVVICHESDEAVFFRGRQVDIIM